MIAIVVALIVVAGTITVMKSSKRIDSDIADSQEDNEIDGDEMADGSECPVPWDWDKYNERIEQRV